MRAVVWKACVVGDDCEERRAALAPPGSCDQLTVRRVVVVLAVLAVHRLRATAAVVFARGRELSRLGCTKTR